MPCRSCAFGGLFLSRLQPLGHRHRPSSQARDPLGQRFYHTKFGALMLRATSPGPTEWPQRSGPQCRGSSMVVGLRHRLAFMAGLGGGDRGSPNPGRAVLGHGCRCPGHCLLSSSSIGGARQFSRGHWSERVVVSFVRDRRHPVLPGARNWAVLYLIAAPSVGLVRPKPACFGNRVDDRPTLRARSPKPLACSRLRGPAGRAGTHPAESWCQALSLPISSSW